MIVIDFDDRVRSFTNEDHGYTVDLRGPGVTELAAAVKKFGDNAPAFQAHIAKEWFVGFEGFVDKAGEPLPNTLETRKKLLDIPAINQFVAEKLRDHAAWLDEKNADSGAAC